MPVCADWTSAPAHWPLRFLGVEARQVSLFGRLIVNTGAHVGTVIAIVECAGTTTEFASTNVTRFEPRYLLTSMASLCDTSRRSVWCLASCFGFLSTDSRIVGFPKFVLKNFI